jgi:hypothetical protein
MANMAKELYNPLLMRDPVVPATDLLAYDEGQLVHYLKRQDRGREFDISSLAGVASLSRSQRDDLTQKLR